MRKLIIAIKAFIAVLFDNQISDSIYNIIKNRSADTDNARIKVNNKEIDTPPAKNDAVILLSLLQRESRLIDFIKENMDSYSDAQIGAAVRSIHRDCGKTLDRIFGIDKLLNNEEGDTIEMPDKIDSEIYSLSGNLTGNPPFKGKLRHFGWRITKCELPKWSGKSENISVISAAEVEVL